MTKRDRLYELQRRLNGFQIYRPQEIEAVAAARNQAEIERLLDLVTDRLRKLYEPAQEEFRNTLSAFVQLFLSVGQTLSVKDPDLEKLNTFGRLLLTRLPGPPEREKLEVAERGTLESYRWKPEVREADLLWNIRRELAPEVADRYRGLMEKRRAETLTGAEHDELIRLTDESERLQAERIDSLAELARLRRTSLAALAGELGFRPRPSA